jgi:predicted ATPase
VEAAPLVAELLGGSPCLTVLVTSRSRLRVSGEHEHAVPPMNLTIPGESIAADSAVAPEAVRLVIERG